MEKKKVSPERLREALLDVCPDAEPAMVEIYDGKVYFYGTIFWEREDEEEVNINDYDLTYSNDEPQIEESELLSIAAKIISERKLFC